MQNSGDETEILPTGAAEQDDDIPMEDAGEPFQDAVIEDDQGLPHGSAAVNNEPKSESDNVVQNRLGLESWTGDEDIDYDAQHDYDTQDDYDNQGDYDNRGDYDNQGDYNLDDSAVNNDADYDSDYDSHNVQRSGNSSSVQTRQFPIQVVLAPPLDPTAYEWVPSWTVENILDEIDLKEDEDEDEDEDADVVLYTVEFQDGRIEEVAYDDILELDNGPRAMQRFQERKFTISQVSMGRAPSKRPLPEEEYYDSESSSSDYRSKRRKVSVRPTRRSTRQVSRQTSVDNGRELNGLDEELDGVILGQEDGEAKSSKSDEHQPGSLGPSAGRVTRSKDPAWRRRHVQPESEDELAQDTRSDQYEDVDDIIPIIRSDLTGPVRTSLRKKRKPKSLYTSSRYPGSDSEIEFETARRSTRSNRALNSMRDPEVDDEYEAAEDKAPSAPKYATVREIFQEGPDESPFRRSHSNICETCRSEANNGKGPLIFCQGCSYSYHKQCIGVRSQRDHRVTKIGPDNFVLQCKFCIGFYEKKDKHAPSHSTCQSCKVRGISCTEFSAKKTPKQEEKSRLENGGEDPITTVRPELLNNAENVLFRCSICRRGYHFEHLPPLNSHPIDEADIKEDRLQEYSLAEWACKDCHGARHKIHALVAWRPADQDVYKKGQQSNEFGEDEMEYLVKWETRSHLHDTWMPGAWIYGVAAPAMRTAFHKREGNELPKMDTQSAIEEEWLLADVFLNVRYRRGSTASSKSQDLARISDVVSVFVKFQGLSYEEAVWDEPPPRNSGALWDAFYAAYDEYLNGTYFPSAKEQKMRERISHYRSLDFQKECELKSQPPGLKEGRSLMPYQMEGVNWLLYNFHQQQNVILADEMGLGKTIQIVSFISSLVEDQPKCWPFLIVVPNATCPNWRRELKDWAPALRVVTYHGGKVSQDLAYKHELFPDGVKDGMKAHVVIMSFEAASTVRTTFHSVKWAGLVVDEGQRLKNEQTQLYRTLLDMNIPCRILLTGTPLQNNKRELFNLLQFIDPRNDAEALDTKYTELTKENLPELHNLIRPYFLRRTKVQVLKFLPPMAQIIVPVTMTVLQERLSKSIVARNPELIKAIISKGKLKAGDRKSLSNILADLRQCLCHPFCFSGDVEDKNVDEQQMQRNLIAASPKLMLLENMLPKLREGGHRVLIFSQFLRCLDIIEDFLNGLGLRHGRIDGNMSALKKQKQIDAFNAPDSPLFAMLLSTRAGGVGINLATADTVIIYDPDWNPHQDIQAISRAHRIGQREKVLCFQLMTKNTVEEQIMQIGKRKMALDHALIESLDADSDANEDLESILKRGAEELFSDKKDNDKDKITYDPASVDRLLDRSKLENTNAGDDQSAETQFSYARVWANDSGTLTDNVNNTGDESAPSADASVWENILKLRQEEHERELAAKQQVYGRGARRRGTQGIDYKSSSRVRFIQGVDDDEFSIKEQRQEPDSGGSDVDVEDELYIDNGVDDEDDEAYEENNHAPVPTKAKAAKGAITQHSQALAMAKQLATDALKASGKALQSTARPQDAAEKLRQLASQTRVPPPHNNNPNNNPPSVPPNRGVNHNFVVSIPHREQFPPAGAPRLSSNTPLPVPPKTLKSSSQVPTQAMRGGLSNRSTNSLPISPTGDGGVCMVCRARHPLNKSCIDFSSEISLRLAIDSLRAGGDQPNVQAFREFLIKQLRQISGR
ncbi:hypothetical protein AAE478_007143 [Parahypoxylon ruwenzoriense]